MSEYNEIAVYGGPPDVFDEPSPRVPFVPTIVTATPLTSILCVTCGQTRQFGLCPDPALVPCATCKRHVRCGEECPFCYADAAAKRQTVDSRLTRGEASTIREAIDLIERYAKDEAGRRACVVGGLRDILAGKVEPDACDVCGKAAETTQRCHACDGAALSKVAKALLLSRSALVGAEGPLNDARVAIDEAKVALAEARKNP